ncbi:pyridoxamine 5'-phosphate oxidase family protein [Olivibacter sitiensis]|uniref:pyridoxamine 5'-phosphate oxidase family protein n=1 Tax=Olivibacter sitiensis TaxID=376470 RepID=UPI000402CA31|nr:pyridoxamine 5'-phosphate oxidase family protein [Olivibacter sitiensis]
MKKYLVPSRAAKRAHYDEATIHAILDEALYCTVSYVSEGLPFSIPTAFVRHGDKLYIHGSVGSHFIRILEQGIPVCISITLMDALVIAKSAVSHSMNYRSVILFATAEKVEDDMQKADALEWLTNKVVPDSWDYLRPMTDKELRKTTVLAFDLAEASAKIRTGMPNDEPEDESLPIWSGIIPLQTSRLAPIGDDSSQGIPLPAHLENLLR